LSKQLDIEILCLSIDRIVFISHTPPHSLPPTDDSQAGNMSNMLHGIDIARLKLDLTSAALEISESPVA